MFKDENLYINKGINDCLFLSWQVSLEKKVTQVLMVHPDRMALMVLKETEASMVSQAHRVQQVKTYRILGFKIDKTVFEERLNCTQS